MVRTLTCLGLVILIIALIALLWCLCGWGLLFLANLLGLAVKITLLHCFLAGLCLSLVASLFRVTVKRNND